ncbi:MAG TPA: cytochrome C oxidase subunit IV family protein [Longimicrobiales bacterium]|nr:cytochrome C oxidase subunit IV family protein [Longimicrobiales bacterium]
MTEQQEAMHGEHSHPGYGTYVVVAIVLTVITALEVAVFYLPAMKPVMVPLLVALSAAKFTLVVMFYMHLKFDSNVFTSVFVAPLTLAILVAIALIVLFRYIPVVTVAVPS